jgi:hypothetical protein
MDFTHALHEWHEFFFLLGTAGATLVALLFVAASLGTGLLSHERTEPTRIYMSPVVIHFASVFFVSAVALVPSHGTNFFAALIGATGIVGLVISGVITTRLLRGMAQGTMDRLAYGLLPALAYLVTLVAAALIFAGKQWSLDVLAGAMLLLLLVNIRNVWDLTLAMIRMPRKRRR